MRKMICAIAAAMLCAAGVAQAADNVVKPINGKDLGGWKLKGDNTEKSHWMIGTAQLDPKDATKLVTEPAKGEKAELINAQGAGVDIFTEEKFGDCVIELELMVPKNSNSGIYLMGEYEVQVLDSWGREKLTQGDFGALYSYAEPKVNASKEPGEWQSVRIEFSAPKFDGDKKVKNAFVHSIRINGKTVQENIEMAKQTPGGLTGKECAEGPLMFQGDHGPVAFRNIHIIRK
ncbi:MAG: DUF1080 domain-containing protein [Thermoguttaceae bacterium]|nr:DUF1080 domain-containing protein [Thermoguttaceae bacterium]